MKLLLTSAGLTNKTIVAALQDLVQKPFGELKLAIVPTAANVESGDKGWLIDDYINCQKQGFWAVDIVDISALTPEQWLPRLSEADVLLFEGGNTFHLMHWLDKTGLAKMLRGLLETRVYVGISAGSMVVCPNLDMSTSERLYEEVPGQDDKDEGLAYVDFLIRPHLNSPYFPNVNLETLAEVAKEFPEDFYALDDNSAIKIDNDEITVVSEGVWKKYSKN